MIINIIDPGMATYAGHHADINFRVAKEFESRGHQVRIYANELFLGENLNLGVIPLVTKNPYDIAHRIATILPLDQQI